MKKALAAAAALAAIAWGGAAQAATLYSGAGVPITDDSTHTTTITVGENFSLSDANVTLNGCRTRFGPTWASR